MAAPTPNSSTGGYLTPAAPAPPYGDELEDILHDVICGVIGYTSDANVQLVRPRWQHEPPNIPDDFSTNWVSFGYSDAKKDWDRYEQHDPSFYGDDGATITQQDEAFTVLLSFYGPGAKALQSQFEDGIKLSQNREAIDALGIKLMGMGDAFNIPALLKQTWVKRVDQRLYMRRRIVRTYPVLNIASASVRSLDNEQYLTDIDINPPTP